MGNPSRDTAGLGRACCQKARPWQRNSKKVFEIAASVHMCVISCNQSINSSAKVCPHDRSNSLSDASSCGVCGTTTTLATHSSTQWCESFFHSSNLRCPIGTERVEDLAHSVYSQLKAALVVCVVDVVVCGDVLRVQHFDLYRSTLVPLTMRPLLDRR